MSQPPAPAAVRLRRGQPGWPARLEHLGDPPAELWVEGALPEGERPWVALVGSRQATPAGLQVAAEVGRDLAMAGIVVVSGMARGIDGAAHRGALRGGGPTVGVLGCGIALCYPAEHRQLREEMARGGAVISEDGGEAPPERWRFPRRNRLIAALAEAVVVVEADERSGALSTARWAADLGREVLAVPGPIRQPASRGTNLLIRDGVRPFLGLSDLFEACPELGRPPHRARRMAVAGGSVEELAGGIGGDPAAVLAALGSAALHPDEVSTLLGLPVHRVMAAVTALHLRGAISEVSGGRLARTL